MQSQDMGLYAEGRSGRIRERCPSDHVLLLHNGKLRKLYAAEMYHCGRILRCALRHALVFFTVLGMRNV